jgi:hypothetical protein
MDIQAQIELEKLTNKNELLPRLRREFNIPEIVAHCMNHDIPVGFALDLLSQMVLHKRAGVGQLVGLLRKHFGNTTEALQECADMLLKAAKVDLVDWDDMSQKFIIKIDVTQDVYDELERYQYPMPMVVRPKEVKTNKDIGFYTTRGSIILKGGHHEDDVCLDHINRVNATKLKINPDTARMIQNEWKDLDRRKPGESETDYKRRVSAFEKYDRCSRDVMEHLFIADNEFYLTHRYDKRGRCYAQGYHVNTQGNDWNKAVVEFAEGEPVR